MNLTLPASILKKVSSLMSTFWRPMAADAAIGAAFGTAFSVMYVVGEMFAQRGGGDVPRMACYCVIAGAVAGVLGGTFGKLCGCIVGKNASGRMCGAPHQQLVEGRTPARRTLVGGSVPANRMTHFFQQHRRRTFRHPSRN